MLGALLGWEGELRNRRVQAVLSLTSVQASRLIAQFRDEYPGVLDSDPSQKRWVPIGALPASVTGKLDEYLATLEADEHWYEDGRMNFLTPHPQVFALVRSACVAGSGLQVMYASMTHPKGHRRVLFPHTMIRLAQRWHVRAWCTQRASFCDFTLGRISHIQRYDGDIPALPLDKDWEERIDVRLGAHRALDLAQEVLVRTEYFGGAAARRLRVRRALVNYVINDIRAAVDPERHAPPEYLLEVLNIDELQRFLFSRGSQLE